MPTLARAIAAVLALVSLSASAASWTYRGTLNDYGQPANGRYDIRLSLLDGSGTRAVAAPITFSDVEVTAGAFAIDVDFAVDLATAPLLKLKTEVAQAGGAFAALGEPKSFDPQAALAAVCWETQGNTGTNGATDFLGTIDVQPLVLKAGNSRVMLFDFPNNVIGGSGANSADTFGGASQTIAGGGSTATNCGDENTAACANTVTADFGSVGGGGGNNVSGVFATVSGGNDNSASGDSAAVGGGRVNLATAPRATVAGGEVNAALNTNAVVSGGAFNRALGANAAVGGGGNNQATGSNSTVPGGSGNCAGGDMSMALGRNAKVRVGNQAGDGNCAASSGDADGDEGAFVWADNPGTDFVSTGPNQFLIRARGGVAINAAPPDGSIELTVSSDADGLDYPNIWLRQRDSPNNGVLLSAGDGLGVNNAGFHIDHFDGFGQGRRLSLNGDGSVQIRSNIVGGATGVTMAAGGGSWSSLSDRSLKTAVAPVDRSAVLDRLVAMPISEWSYIAQGEAVRHIGPMAQDFKQAFALGENDTTIATIDADGVALAAIQGLNRKLETENAALHAQLDAVLERLARLEAAKGQ